MRRRAQRARSRRAERDVRCFLAGLRAAAGINEERATHFRARHAHLAANPDVVPPDLFHGMLSDLEEDAQNAEHLARLTMTLRPPTSMPAALRRAEAHLRAGYQEQIDMLTAQRNRAHHRADHTKRQLRTAEPYLSALLEGLADLPRCLASVDLAKAYDYLRFNFWAEIEEEDGCRTWLRGRDGLRIRVPPAGAEGHADAMSALLTMVAEKEQRHPAAVLAAWYTHERRP